MKRIIFFVAILYFFSLPEPKADQATAIVTITKQDIIESPGWKEIEDLDERIAKLVDNAAHPSTPESNTPLIAALDALEAERYDRIRTFDGLEGLNIILYGEKAIAHKAEFVSHAIHELSMRSGAAGYARYGTIYGWYNARAGGRPWVDFIPPEPGRFDGNDLPTENEVKKGH